MEVIVPEYCINAVRGLLVGCVLFGSLLSSRPVPAESTPSLSVAVGAELNPLSITPQGAAAQSAHLTLISGESETRAEIIGVQPSEGTLPLSGFMTEEGASFRGELNVSGDGIAAGAALLLDVHIGIANTSADTACILRFGTAFVARLNVSGQDAAVDVAWRWQRDGNDLIAEHRIAADSYFGVQAPIAEFSESLEIELAPGAGLIMQQQLDLQADTHLLGFATANDHFDGNVTLLLSLEEVTNVRAIGEPLAVPTLSVWSIILATVIIALISLRRWTDVACC